MSTKEHRDCFAAMFPDDLHLKSNEPNKGKVFTVWLELVGGFSRGDRKIQADIAEWDDCRHLSAAAMDCRDRRSHSTYPALTRILQPIT